MVDFFSHFFKGKAKIRSNASMRRIGRYLKSAENQKYLKGYWGAGDGMKCSCIPCLTHRRNVTAKAIADSSKK